MKYVLFRYEDGSNPYIAITKEETERILKKYKNKIKKISDKYYYVLNKEEQTSFWWND